MKILKFKYLKEDGTEKDVKLMTLSSDMTYHVEGIDITKLNDDEIRILKEASETYWETVKKYFKAFRKYKKESMRDVENDDI